MKQEMIDNKFKQNLFKSEIIPSSMYQSEK